MTEIELFNFRTSLLFQWKVGYYCTQGAETGSIPKLGYIILPFSPEEWCTLCMRGEPNYIGNLYPAVYEIILEAFTNHGNLYPSEIAEIARCMVDYGVDKGILNREDRWESFQKEKEKDHYLSLLVQKRGDQGLLFLSSLEKIRHIAHVVDGL